MSARSPRGALCWTGSVTIALVALLALPGPGSAQTVTVLKAPLTATFPVDSPIPGLRRYDYCYGTFGRPAQPIPLEWEIAFQNDGPTQVNGVSFIDNVRQGTNADRFTLKCPATLVPAGAVVTCDAATNTISLSNVSIPPCGRTIFRFQTIVDATIGLISLCNGGDVTTPTSTMRTKSPLGALQDPGGDDTCIFINSACGLVIWKPYNLRIYHTVSDDNGPPMLPGDPLTYNTAIDVTYFVDFPWPGMDHYYENGVNDSLAALAPYINPRLPDPFTAKPLQPEAIYDFNQANRTISVYQDPNNSNPIVINSGAINPIVTWKATLDCAAPAGVGQCHQGIFAKPGSGFVQSDDPNTYDVIDATCVVPTQPDFTPSVKRIVDADAGGTAQRGEVLTFFVDVSNATSCPTRLLNCECQASDVEVVDTFDPTFLDPASITVNDGGTRNGNTITWKIPTVPGSGRTGNPKSVSFTGRVLNTASDGAQICNLSATVTSAELKNVADPGGKSLCPTRTPTTLAQVCMTVVVPAVPLLSVAKSVDRSPAPATYCGGETATYTVIVTNGGGADATGVQVWDALSNRWAPYTTVITPLNGGTVCVPPDPLCPSGPEVQWPVVTTLPAGASRSFQFQARVPAAPPGTTISNTAYVNAANPAALKNSLPVDIVVGGPTLTFTKALPSPLPTYNELGSIQWTITATNTGTCPATNLAITDSMDVLTLSNIVCTGGTYNAPVCSWPVVASLGPTQSSTVTVSGTINAGTAGRPLCNTADVTYDQGLPVQSTPIPATCPTVSGGNCTTPVPPVGSVKVTKSGANPKPDLRLEWTMVPAAKDGYNVYRVSDKMLIPQAKKLGAPPPTNVCLNVLQAANPFCLEAGAVPGIGGTVYHYQARAVCGGIEDP